ncbi:MAG: hypothetical protein CMJ78_22690 [Planctomycetaceae bacterium]|nr:hypothetical protein [Planctomycetaceae bacterium]
MARWSQSKASNAIWNLQSRLIVTTNYDRILHWSNDQADICANDDDFLLQELFDRRDDGPPMIWHLHGMVHRPDTLILAPANTKICTVPIRNRQNTRPR